MGSRASAPHSPTGYFVSAKGVGDNASAELFVLTFAALQPCASLGEGLLQHLHPTVGGMAWGRVLLCSRHPAAAGLVGLGRPKPHPKQALSLTHDLQRVLSMDTWWNCGHQVHTAMVVRLKLGKGWAMGHCTGVCTAHPHSQADVRIHTPMPQIHETSSKIMQ